MTTADRDLTGYQDIQLHAVWIAESEDRQLIAKGPSLDELVQILLKMGWDPESVYFKYVD